MASNIKEVGATTVRWTKIAGEVAAQAFGLKEDPRNPPKEKKCCLRLQPPEIIPITYYLCDVCGHLIWPGQVIWACSKSWAEPPDKKCYRTAHWQCSKEYQSNEFFTILPNGCPLTHEFDKEKRDQEIEKIKAKGLGKAYQRQPPMPAGEQSKKQGSEG